MKLPRSLQARLGLALCVLLTMLWIAAASVTAVLLRHEMDEIFDAALAETAQRLLPLAVLDIVGRDDVGVTQQLGAIREHDEFFTYLVRDRQGFVLLQSHQADPAIFPAYDGPGFRQTPTHRFYNEDAVQGSIRITVAEPLDHRRMVAREIQIGLGMPLLVVIPVALLVIFLALRASLASLRRFRERLEARSASDLSPVPTGDIPSEIGPIVATLNALLARLNAAFAAERSFAANAAHELRTPLAGAIAQAQRLRAETQDTAAAARATEIETTLKRLSRLSERLMQLARAEGGPIRLDRVSDLRIVARLVIADLTRAIPADRIVLTLPPQPVMSDLDPDAFGILFRNLVENALRHGATTAPMGVSIAPNGLLTVTNDGPVVPPDMLARLTARFERAGQTNEGSGLGLAIVAAIADRIGSTLSLSSPCPGSDRGFQVALQLPVAGGSPLSSGPAHGISA